MANCKHRNRAYHWATGTAARLQQVNGFGCKSADLSAAELRLQLTDVLLLNYSIYLETLNSRLLT